MDDQREICRLLALGDVDGALKLTADPDTRARILKSVEHTRDAGLYRKVYGYQSCTPLPPLPPEAENFVVDPRLQKVCDLIKFYEKRRVLDIGCADGVLLCKLAREGALDSGDGVDVNTNRIRTAFGISDKWGLGDKLMFHNCIFEDFPDDPRRPKYDAVIMGEILEHVMDTGAFVRAAHGFLRDSGMMVVTIPSGNDTQDCSTELSAEVREHVRRLTLEDVHKLFYSVGMIPIWNWTQTRGIWTNTISAAIKGFK